MDEIIFLGVEVVIDGNHLDTEIDLGAVTLSKEGRSYIVDAVQSYRNFEDGQTTISIQVEADKELFDEQSKFDLEPIDLHSPDLVATFYFYCGDEDDEDYEWEHATLFVKFGKEGTTKAIDLIVD
jgi:hypothetical protein